MKNPFKPTARLRELPHGHYIVEVRAGFFFGWDAVATFVEDPKYFTTYSARDNKMRECVTKNRELAERLYEIAKVYVLL